jgi:hypothetical protein
VIARPPQGDDELDLEMQVGGERRVGNNRTIPDQSVGRLGEEERGRALILAHLADMPEIVTAHAPHPARGKDQPRAGNREGRDGRRCDDEPILRAHDRCQPSAQRLRSGAERGDTVMIR